jgi:lipopolysaccharide transport system ATP-binding protein
MLPLIEAHKLSKRYRLGTATRNFDRLTEFISRGVQEQCKLWSGGQQRKRSEERWIWSLDNVSFEVEAGEVVGVIGANGAGKSTLLKVLSRITDPTSGYARLRGRAASLLEVGSGFHPDLTGRENIFLNGSVLGMSNAEVRSKLDQIVAFSEIENYLDTPVKRYSTGMFVRLAFAVAAHLDPEILIVDEVLAVGDLAFQKKCLGKMEDVGKDGRTVLFVSHNLGIVKNLCQRCIVLGRGKLLFDGTVDDAIDYYVNGVLGEGFAADLGAIDLNVAGKRAPEFTVPYLQRVGLYSESGSPLQAFLPYGSPLQVRLDCQFDRPVRHLDVLLSFNSLLDEAIFVANSGFDPNCGSGQFVGEHTFICDIPNFCLVPGDYMLNISLVVRGKWIDCVDNAARFSVMASDHYGTGRVPKHGWCVLPHSWSAYRGRSFSAEADSDPFEAGELTRS